MNYEELLSIADDAQEYAYAIYSNFKVGAALLGVSGKVYSGCNIENASYGAAICAERSALAKAVSEGEKAFLAIAVTTQKADTAMPCGICRQVLSEFSPDMDIVVRKDGKMEVYKLEELLRHRFKL